MAAIPLMRLMKRRKRGDFWKRLVAHSPWVLIALRAVFDVMHLIANWPFS